MGSSEPVAVRPENMRLPCASSTGPLVHREKPREREGSGVPDLAQVAVFDLQDVPMQPEGASYQSSAISVERMCCIPKKIDEAAFAQFVFPRSGGVAGAEDGRMLPAVGADEQADQGWLSQLATAGVDEQTDQDRLPEQPQGCAEEFERECTCCGGCKGTAEQPCERWACKGKVPLCIKCNVGEEEAIARDAALPHCTDKICFRRSGC